MIFTKMQCVGNDFLILNGFDDIIEIQEDLPVKVCDIHFGIGADGLALILYSNDADFKLDFYNPDGIKSPCNTNILRCAVKYALDNKIVDKDLISVETANGIKYVKKENTDQLIINICTHQTDRLFLKVDRLSCSRFIIPIFTEAGSSDLLLYDRSGLFGISDSPHLPESIHVEWK